MTINKEKILASIFFVLMFFAVSAQTDGDSSSTPPPPVPPPPPGLPIDDAIPIAIAAALLYGGRKAIQRGE